MKTSTSRRAAFTLIELLTVIAIIAVLMGLLFPAVNAAKEAGRKAQASADVKGIVTAAKSFQTEYGKYPMPTTASVAAGKDKLFQGTGSPDWNAELIRVLRNVETVTSGTFVNSRRISYMEPRMIKNTANRVAGVDPNNSCYYDPWGTPYLVGVDYSYDGELKSADGGKPAYTTAPYNSSVPYPVVALSYGKDTRIGKAGNAALAGSDDIVSW
jgi:prepilin-type N-terminal cleavage/methylation domain-containing protein